jgi:biopolymer transport protein ExbD
MNLGAQQKPIVSINLTPLVDVSLVLVVIFMATAPMLMQKGITVFPGEKKTKPMPLPIRLRTMYS